MAATTTTTHSLSIPSEQQHEHILSGNQLRQKTETETETKTRWRLQMRTKLENANWKIENQTSNTHNFDCNLICSSVAGARGNNHALQAFIYQYFP